MSTTQIPFGWHFDPNDSETIAILASIPDGQHHHCVTEINVFAKPPWDLFHINDSNDVRYFYTPLMKMSENASKNFKRTVGDSGTWKTETSAAKIYDPITKLVIGSKRYFAFKLSGKRKRTDSDDVSNKFTWGMTEFTIERPNKGYFAICKITRKSIGSRNDNVTRISETENVNSGSVPEIPSRQYGFGFSALQSDQASIPESNSADVNFQEVPRGDYVSTMLENDPVNTASIPCPPYGFSFSDLLSDPAPVPDSNFADVNFQEVPCQDYIPTILENEQVNSGSIPEIPRHPYGIDFSALISDQMPIPEYDFSDPEPTILDFDLDELLDSLYSNPEE